MNYKERIDSSIKKLRSFVSSHSDRMLILEDVDSSKPSEEILKPVVIEDPAQFAKDEKAVIGLWQNPPPYVDPLFMEILEDLFKGKIPPSYKYFLEKYGSLTWLIDNERVPDEIGTSLWNISVAHAALHLPEISKVIDITEKTVRKEYANDLPDRGLEQAVLFEIGGFSEGHAFDTRVVNSEGESLCVIFNENLLDRYWPVDSTLENESDFESFDFLLERRINEKISIVEESEAKENS